MSQPRDAKRLDAIVVGAGFGGMYALHRLREMRLSVLGVEAGDGVGGIMATGPLSVPKGSRHALHGIRRLLRDEPPPSLVNPEALPAWRRRRDQPRPPSAPAISS
ncbi:NAD(P)-binding protein [Sphingomonas sp.]|uniref:NAD(P)-binding protein n=1 Tax=Sphingomonas sp. TaxID=28214 RepID=UPI003CC6AD26